MTFENNNAELKINPEQLAEAAKKIREEVSKAIVGQEMVVEQVLIGLFAGGHILLEGVPGIAKTLLVKVLARVIDCDFKRVQFTPDLMPSDVLGTSVLDLATGKFNLKKGPVFTNLVLADEINRTPPKTQAALLEAMEEGQVTIDGFSHQLDAPFVVFATQNPIEYEGTYPLPEAQLDRFMLKIIVDYPTKEDEQKILENFHRGFSHQNLDDIAISKVLVREEIAAYRKAINQVKVETTIFNYITEIIRATRESINLTLGASPRASIALLLAGKAYAAMQGKDYLSPDDIKYVALPILRHRIILKPEVEIEGRNADDIILNLLSSVEVPR